MVLDVATLRHFTLLPLVEQTKDSSNVIGREKKFVHLAFALEANNQRIMPSKNNYITSIFMNFGAKSLFGWGKFVHDIYENPNSPWADKLSFPNLYKLHDLYILMDFFLVPLTEVCLRSFGLHNCSVEAPPY